MLKKFCNFCNSVKINKKCLKFFLWFVLNVLLAAETSCNKKSYLAHAQGGIKMRGIVMRVLGPATGHLDTGFSWFPCV